MNNTEILANAPEGATHVGIVIYNTAHYYKCESNNWEIMCGNGWTKLDGSELTFLYSPRSIADIEREVDQQAKYAAVCDELEEAHNEIERLKPKWTLCSDEPPPYGSVVVCGWFRLESIRLDYTQTSGDGLSLEWANEDVNQPYDFWFMPPTMPCKPPEAE